MAPQRFKLFYPDRPPRGEPLMAPAGPPGPPGNHPPLADPPAAESPLSEALAALPRLAAALLQEAPPPKHLPPACFVLDRQCRFTYPTPRAEQLLGLLSGRRPAELLGQDVWRACPEVADSTFSRECQQALAEQRSLETET